MLQSLPNRQRVKEIQFSTDNRIKIALPEMLLNTQELLFRKVGYLSLVVCIPLRVWDQGENVFRLRNFNIVGFLLFILLS
jgi:hypothetical protein